MDYEAQLDVRSQVDARGRTFQAETYYSHGTNKEGCEISEDELTHRFFNNAQIILPSEKIFKAMEILRNLEKCDSLKPLAEAVSL